MPKCGGGECCGGGGLGGREGPAGSCVRSAPRAAALQLFSLWLRHHPAQLHILPFPCFPLPRLRRHIWTGYRPYGQQVRAMLAERRNATAAAPLLSQPPPETDYDPAEDDALSTLMQASLCSAYPACVPCLCPCDISPGLQPGAS